MLDNSCIFRIFPSSQFAENYLIKTNKNVNIEFGQLFGIQDKKLRRLKHSKVRLENVTSWKRFNSKY